MYMSGEGWFRVQDLSHWGCHLLRRKSLEKEHLGAGAESKNDPGNSQRIGSDLPVGAVLSAPRALSTYNPTAASTLQEKTLSRDDHGRRAWSLAAASRGPGGPSVGGDDAGTRVRRGTADADCTLRRDGIPRTVSAEACK